MKDVVKVIETLRAQLERHKQSGLKEYPTRTIFVDPLLSALGWDIRDPDKVDSNTRRSMANRLTMR